MKCIFCQKMSGNSKSIEHIIPESMGNKDYILEPGIVCDGCNNFFSIKIEKPLLEEPFFKQSRHKNNTKSKKGIIPSDDGFLIEPEIEKVLIKKDKSAVESFEFESKSILESLEAFDQASLITIEYGPPSLNNPLVSKFLCKVAIEGLAYEVKKSNDSIDLIVNQPNLNLIKRFCRFPKSNEFWPYQIRQSSIVINSDNLDVKNLFKELITEFTFIFTPPWKLLFQFYFAGVEFSIDLCNPTLENVESWIKENPNNSEVIDKAIRKFMGD